MSENVKNNNESESFVKLIENYKDDLSDDIKELLAKIGIKLAVLSSRDMLPEDTADVIYDCQNDLNSLHCYLLGLSFGLGQKFPYKEE